MLKRLLSASFLFLTFTILLAHEIIPHHHHDDHICIEHNSCNHSQTTHNNSENNPEDEACCLLSDWALIIPGSVHCGNSSQTIVKKNLSVDFHTIQGMLLNKPDILLFGPLPFRQNPLVFFIISQPELSSSGLRAPPLS